MRCCERLADVFGSAGRVAAFEQWACDRVYAEATGLPRAGRVESGRQDLFLEQGQTTRPPLANLEIIPCNDVYK